MLQWTEPPPKASPTGYDRLYPRLRTQLTHHSSGPSVCLPFVESDAVCPQMCLPSHPLCTMFSFPQALHFYSLDFLRCTTVSLKDELERQPRERVLPSGEPRLLPPPPLQHPARHGALPGNPPYQYKSELTLTASRPVCRASS